MKFKKVIELTVSTIILGLALTTLGAGPPPPTGTPPAPKAGTESFPLQPATAVLNLATAQAIPLSQAEVEISSEPVITQTRPLTIAVIGEYDGQELKFTPVGREIGDLSQVSASAETTVILSEDFEAPLSSPPWQLYDNNGSTGGIYSWGRKPCYSATGFPLGSPGFRSIWVAGASTGPPTPNPCPTSNAPYPANLDSWLVYGPFSLEDAQSAWFDFYYWLDNGGDSGDKLFWGVSLNADSVDPFAPATFKGQTISGNYTDGPFINSTSGGHNFVSIDLTQVPILGDVTGESEVWIGFRFISDGDAQAGLGAFIDSVSIRKNPGEQRQITLETFETTFPNGYESWLSHDNNGAIGGSYRWGSANCKALSGTKSMWIARDNGQPGGVNPCVGTPSYPASIESWLLYGPFSLENVAEAWVDFYFRSDSEPGGDFISWQASIDGTNYHGPGISSTFTTGPYGPNGYNRVQFDLSQVPVLGDLRGESTVWIAFIFESDSDALVGEGVFIDDVTVNVVNNNQIFLPALIKSEPVPVGGITFSNFTNNPVIIELVGIGQRTFPGTPGPHVWSNIPAGVYDWKASGTCPAGQGQVGSLPPSNRQKVTIVPNVNNNPINVENGGEFDCSG